MVDKPSDIHPSPLQPILVGKGYYVRSQGPVVYTVFHLLKTPGRYIFFSPSSRILSSSASSETTASNIGCTALHKVWVILLSILDGRLAQLFLDAVTTSRSSITFRRGTPCPLTSVGFDATSPCTVVATQEYIHSDQREFYTRLSTDRFVTRSLIWRTGD